VVNSDTELKLPHDNNGLSQCPERNEKINNDMRVRRMINMWTDGMSALEQARMEGRDEGRKGRKGRDEVAARALQQGLLADLISTIAKLPIERIKELKSRFDEVDSEKSN